MNVSHHALLYISEDRDTLAEKLFAEYKNKSLSSELISSTVLDVETARRIAQFASSPHQGNKVAVISFHTSGHEAQNLLLKTLEEPRPGVRFILVTSNKEKLLPTVLSRVEEVAVESGSTFTREAEVFLETHPKDRMSLPYIKQLLLQEDEEGRKDRESVRAFIGGIVSYLGQDIHFLKYVEDTLKCMSYAGDPSASVKAILEYLSLLLPLKKM